jgi:putative lipoic acid-binding regulatory protein
MTSPDQPSLIEYPCDFPIKIVGRVVTGAPGASGKPDTPGTPASSADSRPDGPADGEDLPFPPASQVATAALLEQRRQDFMQSVLSIVTRHAPDFDPATLEVRISRKNTYLSLTCTILATSREQLDRLYQELCDQPNVVMVL